MAGVDSSKFNGWLYSFWSTIEYYSRRENRDFVLRKKEPQGGWGWGMGRGPTRGQVHLRELSWEESAWRYKEHCSSPQETETFSGDRLIFKWVGNQYQ